MDSLDVTSCFQVPRNTCYYALIGDIFIKISLGQDGKHNLEVFADKACTIGPAASESHGDFSCFNIAGVCGMFVTILITLGL